jgi:hypothetical protein
MPAGAFSPPTFAPRSVQNSRGSKLEVQAAARFNAIDFYDSFAHTFQNSKSRLLTPCKIAFESRTTEVRVERTARLLHHLAQFVVQKSAPSASQVLVQSSVGVLNPSPTFEPRCESKSLFESAFREVGATDMSARTLSASARAIARKEKCRTHSNGLRARRRSFNVAGRLRRDSQLPKIESLCAPVYGPGAISSPDLQLPVLYICP